MAFKLVVICAAALFVQTISAACLGASLASSNSIMPGFTSNFAGTNLGINSYPSMSNLGTSSGGGFVVTSASPIAPTGVSVLAENLAIEGPVSVGGQMPLLGVVSLEGQVPTGGQAGVSYSCGNGNVGIMSENGPIGSSARYPGVDIRSGFANRAGFGNGAAFANGAGFINGAGYANGANFANAARYGNGLANAGIAGSMASASAAAGGSAMSF